MNYRKVIPLPFARNLFPFFAVALSLILSLLLPTHNALATTGSGTTGSNYASSITETSAVLTAQIVALDGGPGPIIPVLTRGFLYGIGTAYDLRTTENGFFNVGYYSASISSLSCGTTYNVVAYTIDQTNTWQYGPAVAFTTSACPPAATLTSATKSGSTVVVKGYNFDLAKTYQVQFTDRRNGNVIGAWLSPKLSVIDFGGGQLGVIATITDNRLLSTVFDINVLDSSGQWSNKVPFIIPPPPPPVLASAKNTSGTVAIFGTGFSTDAQNFVRFTNVSTGAQITVPGVAANAIGIVVALPNSFSQGTFAVTVSNSGSAWSNAVNLTINLTISDITPDSAPPGGTITITGDGFAPTGNSVEFVNSTDESKTFTVSNIASTRKSLKVKVPKTISKGTYNVRVVQKDGTESNSSSLDVTPIVIVAVSGLGTTSGSRYFDWLHKEFPDNFDYSSVTTIASGVHGPDVVTAKIHASVDKVLADGNRALVVSHSQGTAYAYGLRDTFAGDNVQFIYVDPPYNESICKTALGHLISWFRAVGTAASNGIGKSRDSVIWTGGKGLEHFVTHDPFDFPKANRVNVANLLGLKKTIQNKLISSCGTSCSADVDPLGTTIDAAPQITGLSSPRGEVIDAIYPGSDKTILIAGARFSAYGNSAIIKSKSDPAVYYQSYDLTPDASGAVPFVVPAKAFPPSSFISGDYTIQIAAVDSDWSAPYVLRLSLAPEIENAVIGSGQLTISADGLNAKAKNWVRVTDRKTKKVTTLKKLVPNASEDIVIASSSRLALSATGNYSVEVSTNGKDWSSPATAASAAVATAILRRSMEPHSTNQPKMASSRDEASTVTSVRTSTITSTTRISEPAETGSNNAATNPPPSQITRGKACLDFDNDGASDIAFSTAKKTKISYKVLLSGGGAREFSFDETSKRLAPADYEGTGATNFATISGTSGALIWKIHASDGSTKEVLFTPAIDTALSGCDFDGDGKSDIAGIDRNNRVLHYISSLDATNRALLLPFHEDASIEALSCGNFAADGADALLTEVTEGGSRYLRAVDATGTLLFERKINYSAVTDIFSFTPKAGALPLVGAVEKRYGNSLKFRMYVSDGPATAQQQFELRAEPGISIGTFLNSQNDLTPGAIAVTPQKQLARVTFNDGKISLLHKELASTFKKLPRRAQLLRCVNTWRVD